MNKLMIGLAVVAAASATGAGVAAASSAVANHGTQFTIDAHDDVFKAVNAPGSDQPQPGDSFVEHWTLKRSGSPVGGMDNQCIILAADQPAALCNFAITIDGEGTVTATDRVSFHPSGEGMDPDPSDAAITGGTGQYRNAHGQIHVVVNDPDATLAFDLR